MTRNELWQRYRQYLCTCPRTGLRLDVSRMSFGQAFLEAMRAPLERAFDDMEALESGALANPDEGRMVGHFWLRDPERAPQPEIASQIRNTWTAVKEFTARVHSAAVRPQRAPRFANVLLIGIGGSALGPQLLADALQPAGDSLRFFSIDNTDADGIERELARIPGGLGATLCLVISKSGGTIETRNGMVEVAHRYRAQSLDFGRHAVAVTGETSVLHQAAEREGWLAVFPMWDWVGGRFSVTSAVGLLPAALLGCDMDAFLAGARDMDETTRHRHMLRNPAALLALMWHYATEGHGRKDMVVLPYKDRLALFSRYLQQLVMESLGKEKDLDGRVVHQGLAVYGNKGSTDQHACIQELRDGLSDFFVTFIEVLRDYHAAIQVEPGVTTDDYLHGFLYGTREALFESGRESMTLVLPDLSPRCLGALIALYERTVGLYASMININAYHQPGVEAGKKAAAQVIELQKRVIAALELGEVATADSQEIANRIGASESVEDVHRILERLTINNRR